MSLDFQRLERVLAEAAAKGNAEERAAYLAQACGDDSELRAEVERLLAAHEKVGDFLETPFQPVPEQLPGKTESDIAIERTGARIGRYKLLEEIGEGGFGVVYMAEQIEPVHRKVALKIIKAGMATREVVARFEAERQALALMDHPSIAQVFDGGATQTGRPYFVMELVRGIAITDFCDQRKLSTRERLQLFVQVCHAVQHAHQKGIIHRDLKPSNILVTLVDGEAVPKIIDFGVAKALGQRLTDKTLFTSFLRMVGTPAYMSPEQADLSGVDIDTRTDIYALGVLLYELLTGVTPFDAETLRQAALDEVRRMIRETEPPRPSTRLQTLGDRLAEVAKYRQSEPAALSRLVRGDLDWIAMKCLEKDRRRRYETANSLADDIGRHLEQQPVSASPPSTIYRLGKFVRRHRMGVALGASVGAALVLGLLAALVGFTQARLAEREQTRLRLSAQRAEEAQKRDKIAAQQFLYQALVGEARATRLARRVGYRDRVFALLQQAKELDVPQRDLAELRLEAVACLGDFVGLTPVALNDFPTNTVACCLDPAGALVAFELCDRTIQVRALPSGKELARLRLPEGTFQSFSFNATGDQLFATCESPPSSRINGWARGSDGHWWETVNRYDRPVAGGLLSSEVGVFAVDVSSLPSDDVQGPEAGETGDGRMRFRLIRLDTGTFMPGFDVIAGSFTNYVATPDGRLLAVATVDSRKPKSAVVNLYDWKAGTRLNQLSVPWPSAMSLSKDGSYLACLSSEGAAIYSVSCLERVGHLKRFFFGPATAVFRGTTVALPRQQQLRIHLWDFATGEEIALLDEPEEASPVAFTAKGDALLTFGAHHARLYHLETPEKLDLPAHNAAVPGIAFSPDGTRLASVGKDHVVRVCDTLAGRTLWETNDLPGEGQCVAYSPDGRWLVIGLWDRNLVWIRDAQTGKRLLDPQTNRVGQTYSTQFSPDGRFLAMAGSVTSQDARFPATVGSEAGMQAEREVADGIKIWRLEGGGFNNMDGALKATLVRSWAEGSGLVFAPDSRSIAFSSVGLGSKVEYFYLWDFESSSEPKSVGFRGPGAVQGCDFTPDGHRLLAIDDDGAVVTTDVGTGEQISSFQVWNSQTMGVAGRSTQFLSLSPDGSRLAVSSPSRLGVEIRHPSTGEILYSLREEAGTVFWLAWSPDSRRIAVSRDNGNIAVWNLDIIDQTLAELGLNP